MQSSGCMRMHARRRVHEETPFCQHADCRLTHAGARRKMRGRGGMHAMRQAIEVSGPLTVRLAVLRDPAPMSQIDAFLRRRGLAALSALPGVVEAYAGRRGPDQNGERVIATVWSSYDEAAR